MSGTSDLISRAEAVHAITSHDGVVDKSVAKRLLIQLQSVQPKPDIIACGDCKHWICHDKRCGYWNHGAKPLDWCCHAERKE